MDEAAFQRTADIAKQFGVIKHARRATHTAPTWPRRPSRVEDEGVDVNGADWEKETVEVTAGGE